MISAITSRIWKNKTSEVSKIWALGNPALLDLPLLGIFSSVKCPARLILKAHDTARELAASGQAVIGGFQSPVEKEMLTVLLRGQSPIVICPARGLEGMRIPLAWRPKLAAGELLILSPFPAYVKRPQAESIHKRNLLVLEIASEALIIHAEPGGKVEQIVRAAQRAGKPVRRLE